MEAFLFYVEDDSLIPNQRRMIGAWCAMAGLTHIMVDRTGTLRRTNGNVFAAIQDAVAAFPDHRWVFMSEKAERPLGEYKHPVSNVIYCVGSDTDGYQGMNLSGYTALRLSTPHRPDTEWYASTVVPIVIADRLLRL